MNFSRIGFAENLCAPLFLKEQPLRPIPSAANQNSPLQLQVEQQIKEWNDLLGEMAAPEVKIVLGDFAIQSSFFHGTENSMHLGIQGIFSLLERIITGHEFTHGVFLEHFTIIIQGEEIRFKELAQAAQRDILNMDKDPSIRKAYQRMGELNGLMKLALEVRDDYTIEKLKVLMQEQSAILDPALGNLNAYNFMAKFVDPYNEFLADTFPVIITGDVHAMASVSRAEKMTDLELLRYRLLHRSQIDPDLPTRDFSTFGFKGWKHQINDDYTLFDPSRGVLWNLYMNQLQRSEIPLFVKTFLLATKNHLQQRIERGEITEDIVVDASQLNKEFVGHFVEAAKFYKLPIRKNEKDREYDTYKTLKDLFRFLSFPSMDQ